MTDLERIEAANKRYMAACHAMQSGVAMDHGQGSTDGSPKHLRVGINSAMAGQQALANLLIKSGAFTLAEYHEAQADAMEEEAARYTKLLSDKFGTKVTLA